ncbi:MAG: hypothetical protein U0270_29315 [Labilithrix sp.]
MSWVLAPSALIDACGHVAPELGLSPKASATALRIAMREADHLSDDVYDVPGAVLFALGRTPRCFAAFRSMSVLATQWQAKALGFKLEATPLELASILGRVARGEMDYVAVRAWVAERLLPFGG